MASRTTPEFVIHYLDGRSETVQMLPRHQVAYEAREKKSLGAGDGVTDLYKMAWYATGQVGTFDEFLDTLQGVDPATSEEADELPLPDTDD